MEAAAWNLRECSVRLWRCDGAGVAERTYRDIRAAPLDPRASTVPRVEHRIQRTYEASALDVEVECDVKNVFVKQELVEEEEYIHTWKNIKAEPDFTEACSSVLLVKSEMDGNIIKEELDLGPVQLQSRTIPLVDLSTLKLSHVDVQAGLPDRLSSMGSVGGAASGQLRTPMSKLSRSAGRHAGAYCYEGGPEVLFDTNIKLELSETNDPLQKVLRKQFCGSSNSRDSSTGTRDFAEKPYKCDGHITTTQTNFLNSLNTHLKIKQYKCKQCEFSTSLLDDLKRHILTHTGEKRFTCEECEYSASVLGKLKIHMLTHTGEKPYKCEQCEYMATQQGHLKQHMRTHTGEKPYKCEQCEYSASRLGNLKQHMLTHTGEKPYKCEQCEYRASQQGHLKQHMRTHTGEKPYKCEQCEYSTSGLGNLKRHMYIHTGEKPYKCKQCEYSTSELGSLKRHMHIHTGKKPYKCKQCEYRASRLGLLKLHMHTHSGEKPYKCKQCEYSTSQLSHLKRHVRSHTGEKPYKCEQCEYRASRLGNLKQHMLTHTGEKPYKCKQREYRASRLGDLKRCEQCAYRASSILSK